MRIVIANGPGKLDSGPGVILFPSRWDSAVPHARFQFYPYELGYLSTLLKREMPEAETTLIDGNLHGWDGDRYAAEIASLGPDVLVSECSALTYPTMTRIVQDAGVSTSILCGPMGTHDPGRATADGWSHVIAGEYEAKALALLQGKPKPTGYIDLDWLPWPEDEDIRRIDYYECNHYAPGIVQLYASRGCPLACAFCAVPTYYGGHGKSHRSHRTRNVEDVCAEIEYLAQRYPTFGGCYFNEEAHNADVDWLMSLCEALIAHGLNRYQYDAMCGYWTMTEEIVKAMASAGYKQFRFGVESTSEAVGKAIKKTMHLERIEELLGWLKKHGINAYGTFQIGALGSTEATDRATLADLKRWRDSGLMQKWQVSTSTPQPGTPFYATAEAEGWLLSDDVRRFDGYHSVVSYPHYTAERIMDVRLAA